ncbi:sugar transferase [Tranquillimonas alkanivorans]|uniref:Sugar transferase involved in LPS biosynthesis (Colanic, teichoic acid) n=1 Tax=Tranquillimonas alkanivorans TaxID=441119 RepID=A0A1I5KGG8_9RHOB|nr:sugar transferase [Tranquillimonas alkanivorans]SFO84135.1 Sugar transferase involved in LPS biosynthesis (colanic, teichoic acid) [Tranquillimonas alkanivorans]
MTPAKRAFDIVLALVLGLVLLPPLALLLLVLLATSGRPLFYGSERMKTPERGFTLWKLRTMTVVRDDAGVSGGDKSTRITPAGRILRRTRLDEIPQLWNVLRGDMSFVGPRPPLRQYVERFPDLYARVLRSRPGITGLATLRYHRHEERLLARCGSAAQTDLVYARRCVPRKATLDLIYQRNRTLCLDLALVGETAARALCVRASRMRTRRPTRLHM